MSADLLDQLTATAHNSGWMADASCVGLWGYFDPAEPGETARTTRVAEAAATCHTCPVIDACHRSAQTPTIYGTAGLGIRAGLLYGKYRTPSVIPVRDPDAICGTLPGLANHHSRRESPCDDCRLVAESIQAVETLPAPREPDAHGTQNRVMQHHRDNDPLCGPCQVTEDERLVSARPNNLRKYHARQERLRAEAQAAEAHERFGHYNEATLAGLRVQLVRYRDSDVSPSLIRGVETQIRKLEAQMAEYEAGEAA